MWKRERRSKKKVGGRENRGSEEKEVEFEKDGQKLIVLLFSMSRVFLYSTQMRQYTNNQLISNYWVKRLKRRGNLRPTPLSGTYVFRIHSLSFYILYWTWCFYLYEKVSFQTKALSWKPDHPQAKQSTVIERDVSIHTVAEYAEDRRSMFVLHHWKSKLETYFCFAVHISSNIPCIDKCLNCWCHWDFISCLNLLCPYRFGEN
jgi:hypothetical protein